MDVSEIRMDWKNYHRLHTIYEFMDELAADYPYLCSVTVIGQTAEGRELKVHIFKYTIFIQCLLISLSFKILWTISLTKII